MIRLRTLGLALLLLVAGHAHAAGGGIDPAHSYAWSEEYGWLNWYASGSGINVTDSGLTGYVWNENTGWISLHVSGTTYVHNDGAGNLSGYAWSEGIGFVDFSGVTIDTQGYFHGYAHTATGGRISFTCANTDTCGASDFSVKTYWTPAVSSPPPTGGGGGGGGGGGSKAAKASGGGSGGRAVSSATSTPVKATPVMAAPLPTAGGGRACVRYMHGYIKPGAPNDPDQVLKLQSFLTLFDHAPGLTQNGIYDARTIGATRSFQSEYAPYILAPWGFTQPTAYVYITTLNAINALYCGHLPGTVALVDSLPQDFLTRDLSVGSVGPDVRVLQATLNLYGYTIATSGPGAKGQETTLFGALTKAALVRFQADHGIVPATGVFDAATRQAFK